MGFFNNKIFRFTEKLVRKHRVSIYPLPHPSVQPPTINILCWSAAKNKTKKSILIQYY